MKFRLLKDVSGRELFMDDTCSNKPEGIIRLYEEVKAVKSRSLDCSMAAYRSRIAQVTYLFNSMATLFNSLEEHQKTEDLETKLEWVLDEINSMWEGLTEW